MIHPRPSPENPSDPHGGRPIATAGPPAQHADLALILMHGRGAGAEDILSLYGIIGLKTISAFAPEAAGNTWYPNSFLAPLKSNQPFLDSALRRIESLVSDLIARGISSERIALLGFSQGACLTLEFLARHPRRYAAAIGLTGGLIGPPGTTRNYPGSLAATPIFLGSSDPDPHVPFQRVQETESVLTRMGAEVELRRYPGMSHTINNEELDAARILLQRVIPH